jgi:hypothetical protein
MEDDRAVAEVVILSLHGHSHHPPDGGEVGQQQPDEDVVEQHPYCSCDVFYLILRIFPIFFLSFLRFYDFSRILQFPVYIFAKLFSRIRENCIKRGKKIVKILEIWNKFGNSCNCIKLMEIFD